MTFGGLTRYFPPCYSIAASKAFHILVGPEKKSFIMHSELLARQSKPLEKLVKGGMKEAADGIAEWPEVDPETFFRFWQFTYTGDYTGAEPTEVPPTPPTLTAAEPTTDTRQSLNPNVADISSVTVKSDNDQESETPKEINEGPRTLDGSRTLDGPLGGVPISYPPLRTGRLL